MSTPSNPLSNFRSVSYYHVLVACDCTQTAETLSTLTEELVWRHPSPDEVNSEVYKRYRKYSPRKIKLLEDDQSVNTTGKYCVLINGAQDADLTIENVEYVAVTAAAATTNDRGTSIAMEGRLDVSEPRGIVFTNVVVDACAAMSVDASQCVFVLKTFFVGHAHDIKSQVDSPASIVDIEPLRFICTDLTGSFSERGGLYTMKFVCLQYGITRMPQYSKTADSLTIKAGTTLQATLKNLEAHINDRYRQMYNCVVQQLDPSVAPGVQRNAQSRLQPVRYIIEVDPDSDYALNPNKYTVTNMPGHYKDDPDCDAPSHFMFDEMTSIEDAIHGIMLRTTAVQDEMSKWDKLDDRILTPRYTYKIHPSYKSVPVDGEEGGTPRYVYEVRYRVSRVPDPKTLDIFKLVASDTPEGDRVRRNVMEFDYIYTGKNIDILQFDINLNYGFAFLQIATTSNSLKESMEALTSKSYAAGNGATEVNRYAPDSPIPVFFSSSIDSSVFRNVQDTTTSIQSAYTMTKHASLEALESNMTIYGNPYLLGTVNRMSSDDARRRRDESAPFADFTEYPALAKVNIRMPAANDDIALQSGSSQASGSATSDYTKEFWFTGYYYVVGVQNNFKEGVFTQTLNMLSLPDPKDFDIASDAISTKSADFSKRVESCFDGQRKSRRGTPTQESNANTGTDRSGSRTGPTATGKLQRADDPVPTQRAVVPQPTHRTEGKKDDVDALIRSLGNDPTTIKTARGNILYVETSEFLRTSIDRAASAKSVSANTIARIAAIEAIGFKSSSKNPLSTATGTFQIVEKTWRGLVRQGSIPGVPPDSPDSVSMPLRSQDDTAAHGAAALLKESQRVFASRGVQDPTSPTYAYLGHFLGAPTAVTLIKHYESGNSNMLFSDLPELTASQKRSIQAANPGIIKNNTTVADIVNFSATKMLNTVVNVKNVVTTPPPAPTAVEVTDQRVYTLEPVVDEEIDTTGKTATEAVHNATGEPNNGAETSTDIRDGSNYAFDASRLRYDLDEAEYQKWVLAQDKAAPKRETGEKIDDYSARVVKYFVEKSKKTKTPMGTKKLCSR